MAVEAEKIIGAENITAGVVNTVPGKYHLEKVEIRAAGHPLPDKKGQEGTLKILALKGKYGINEKDLMVCLFSGGG
jgi:glycerate-2-kinase